MNEEGKWGWFYMQMSGGILCLCEKRVSLLDSANFVGSFSLVKNEGEKTKKCGK